MGPAAHGGCRHHGGNRCGGREKDVSPGVVLENTVDRAHHERWEESAQSSCGTHHPCYRADSLGRDETGDEREDRAGARTERRRHAEECDRAVRDEGELERGNEGKHGHDGKDADQDRDGVQPVGQPAADRSPRDGEEDEASRTVSSVGSGQVIGVVVA